MSKNPEGRVKSPARAAPTMLARRKRLVFNLI